MKGLAFLVLAIANVGANFLHQVAPNEFNIDIEERGVRILQKVKFENGLRITEVPQHHHLSAATFVYDNIRV